MDRSLQTYNTGPAAGAKAPILLMHFEGAIDAGASGSLAIRQMLKSLHVERVATFTSDFFIDYRSHRPTMKVTDWVYSELSTPEIALDLVHDDMGQPILVLHGPEPDARWETFLSDLTRIVEDAGVEIIFSFHGLPSGVPHTRPAQVNIQSTDPDLVPEQPKMLGTLYFPSPMTTFLQKRLSEIGIAGIALLVAVPYYISEGAYPKAASALLTRLSQMTNLSLPVGDLEQGSDEELEQIASLVEDNPEVASTIEALEQNYDAIEGKDLDSSLSIQKNMWEKKGSDDIGDVIEAYLANRTKREKDSLAAVQNPSDIDGEIVAESQEKTRPAETLEDVQRRIAMRNKDLDAAGKRSHLTSYVGRHRAVPESDGNAGGNNSHAKGQNTPDDYMHEGRGTPPESDIENSTDGESKKKN